MNWFRLALQLRGSVAPTVFPRVLFFGCLGFLISLLYYWEIPVYWNVLNSIISNVVFNLVLGLLLVFRTNTAYDRLWEGRKLWGTLVINIRNLSRQIWVGVAEVEAQQDREEKIAALRLLSAFAIITKLHLREEAVNNEVEKLVKPSEYLQLKEVKNPALTVALWIGNYIQKQQNRNCINSNQLMAMNSLLDNLVEAFTGCDRIAKTPIPLAYSIYLKRLLLIYCLFLPFQGVDKWQWWTGLIVALISFILLGVEEIGNEIEHPFGYDPNDLPIDDICKSLLQNTEDLINSGNIAVLALNDVQAHHQN